MGTLEIMTGDITRLDVDVIVNAANATLLGGGGVDGAIHRNAGPTLLEECRKLRKSRFPDGLPTGSAVITGAGQLLARYVIHTVGPVFHQDPDPHQRLADCYRNSLLLAEQVGARSIAFPGISTGVYRFPKADAARIAITCVREFLDGASQNLSRIILCAFSEDDARILRVARDRSQA
ncbi:MAG: O-acetyl-ADP-ribose deacetylase [Magnetococcales bacterium]|nr:O-acetyl-ADP-ribose deacetylase [Magnetococcales bacterium]